MSLGQIRSEANGSVIALQRRLEPTQVLQHRPAIHVSLGQIRFDRDGSVEARQSRLQLPELLLRVAAVRIGRRVIGLDRNGAVVARQGACKIIELGKRHAPVAVRSRMLRPDANRPIEQLERPLEMAGLRGDQCCEEQCFEMSGRPPRAAAPGALAPQRIARCGEEQRLPRIRRARLRWADHSRCVAIDAPIWMRGTRRILPENRGSMRRSRVPAGEVICFNPTMSSEWLPLQHHYERCLARPAQRRSGWTGPTHGIWRSGSMYNFRYSARCLPERRRPACSISVAGRPY